MENPSSLLDLCIKVLIKNVIFPEKYEISDDLMEKLDLCRRNYNHEKVLKKYNYSQKILKLSNSYGIFNLILNDNPKYYNNKKCTIELRLYPHKQLKTQYKYKIPKSIYKIKYVDFCRQPITFKFDDGQKTIWRWNHKPIYCQEFTKLSIITPNKYLGLKIQICFKTYSDFSA